MTDQVDHRSEAGQDPAPPDILVVDDNVANLQLLTGMLKENGYRVRPVTEGKLALQAARKKKPDLVLLDVNMPQMDGFETCEALKGEPELSAVPVIFVSALSDTLDKVRGFEVGGVDYITKPFQFEEVQARVSTHLELARLRNRLSERNRALRKANRELQELTELGENLTNLIIHDLRAPLAGIMGYLELLQINSVGQLADEFREDIDKALAVANRMHEMINSLLDVTRLEQASMPINATRCDVAELADEAMTSLESLADYRHVKTEFPDAEVLVEADATLIRRVIVNFLHNALKFTSRNGRILLRVEKSDNQAVVSVEDDGPGIPEDFVDKVFEKFGISDMKSRTQGPLPGLGLAFCKLCIEAHGGEVGYRAADGKGSIFWFKLPLLGQA